MQLTNYDINAIGETDKIYKFELKNLRGKGLDENTIEFLSETGLPTDAAPFLGFANNEFEHNLESIYKVYDTEEPEHKIFLTIGSDGSGNPICIDIKNNCQVVLCDHEDYFEPYFMNSSVTKLYEFLCIYKAFVEEVNETMGEHAFLDCDFNDEQFEKLKSEMVKSDPHAVKDGTVWNDELEMLLGNREYYKNEKK